MSEARYQYLPNSSVEASDVIIQRFAFGESVSAKEGSAAAPDAILKATEQIEYYDEDLEWSPMQYLRVRVCESISHYSEIRTATDSLHLRENQLLISLGGDHSITPQITRALLKQEATVLFLDAHADLRASYQNNTMSHATPAYHILAEGHKMIMVGVRSLFELEAKRIQEDEKIIFFSDRECHKESRRAALLALIASLQGDVYLSIDMDVFNPAFVPSVGTPQPGGIDYYFATDILEALFLNSNAKIKGVDMVELIPESSQVSQVFAAKLLQKIISYWGKSRGSEKGTKEGAQMLVEYE